MSIPGINKLPQQLQDVVSNFYQNEQDDMKKINQAVQNASQNQDNADTSTDSTQQSS